MQTLQNQGLYIAFNQHYLPYDEKESTEVLHRQANVFRLSHRRKIHMLSFLFNYKNCVELVDKRELPTRRHDGSLFKEINTVHHKVKQSPFYRAIMAWNSLPVNVRNSENKESFKRLLVYEIQNPFKTFV